IIVDIIGLDYENEQYKLYLYPFGEDTSVITSFGKTIEETMQNAEINTNKNIFTKQTNAIVFGEKIYKNGIKDITNKFNDSKKYNLKMEIYTINNVEDLFYDIDINTVNSSKYNKLIKDENKYYILNKKLLDIYTNEYDESFYLPNISIDNKDIAKIDSATLFNNNFFVDFLSFNDIVNIEVLNGRLKNTYFNLNLDNQISVFIEKCSVKKKGNIFNIILNLKDDNINIDLLKDPIKDSIIKTILKTYKYNDLYDIKDADDIEITIKNN
ncbi:MAG: hypothetical protein ACRCZK_04415, partial [Oscillospiraceae bacterium]